MAKNHNGHTFRPTFTISTPRHKQQACYHCILFVLTFITIFPSILFIFIFHASSSFPPWTPLSLLHSFPLLQKFLSPLITFSYSDVNSLFHLFLLSLQRPDPHSCCDPSLKGPKSYLNRTRARPIKPGQAPIHFPVHPEPQCPHARRRPKLRDIANSEIENAIEVLTKILVLTLNAGFDDSNMFTNPVSNRNHWLYPKYTCSIFKHEFIDILDMILSSKMQATSIDWA
jgi:hypothetical protein